MLRVSAHCRPGRRGRLAVTWSSSEDLAIAPVAEGIVRTTVLKSCQLRCLGLFTSVTGKADFDLVTIKG